MRDFPFIRHVPSEGSFPFGPPQLTLRSFSGPVLAGRGQLGFRVDLYRRPPLAKRLGWRIVLRVVRLSARGVERGTVARRWAKLNQAQEVGREGMQLGASVRSHPGFYRVDISIDNAHDVTLGRYSEYVRVVVPRVDVRLVLGGGQFHPGGALRAKLQNRGSVEIAYMPQELQLERHDQSGWHVVPREEVGIGVGIVGFLPGGVVSGCYGLQLPTTLVPGAYRAVQPVTAKPRTFPLRAAFHVG